jgi:hypothetical protein
MRLRLIGLFKQNCGGSNPEDSAVDRLGGWQEARGDAADRKRVNNNLEPFFRFAHFDAQAIHFLFRFGFLLPRDDKITPLRAGLFQFVDRFPSVEIWW